MNETDVDTAPASVTEVEDAATPGDPSTGEACPRCTAARVADVPFCTHCSLRFLPTSAWLVRQADAPVVERIAQQPRRRGRSLLLLLLVLLVVAGTVAVRLLG
jgi:hypothetical protein